MDHGVSEPKCKAILLCRQTIVEAGTGNISLIGVFTHIVLNKTPGSTDPLECFLQFTDAEGRYDLTVEIHDQSENKIVARAVAPAIEVPHRLAYANVIIPIPSLQIKHSGPYDFVVFANGNEIDRQQFQVMKVAEPDEDETQNDEDS